MLKTGSLRFPFFGIAVLPPFQEMPDKVCVGVSLCGYLVGSLDFNFFEGNSGSLGTQTFFPTFCRGSFVTTNIKPGTCFQWRRLFFSPL